MKKRNGFVSNSSSSSFMIPKSCLTQEQIDLICSHHDSSQDSENICQKDEEWNIVEDEHAIKGYTFIDNFDMEEFLIKIVKVDDKNIHWE